MGETRMDRHERDLRDPRLSRALHSALSAERAPEAWKRDALARVREEAASRADLPLRPQPLVRELLPHLCAILVLAGAGIAVLVQPQVVADLWTALRSAGSPTGSLSLGTETFPITPTLLLGSLLVPLVVALTALEASRGFADLRRWLN